MTDHPEFIRQPNKHIPRAATTKAVYRPQHIKEAMDGTSDYSSYRGMGDWNLRDKNQISIMEVGLEMMYINGWTGDSVMKSKRRQEQLTGLVLQKYRENGWMVNPQRVKTVRDDWNIPVSSTDDTAYIDMAAGTEQIYTWNVLKGMCRYANMGAGMKNWSLDTSARHAIHPEKPDSWPPFLNPVLNPSTRLVSPYKVKRYDPPTFDTDNLPWYQKILIPFIYAKGWLGSQHWVLQVALFVIFLYIVYRIFG